VKIGSTTGFTRPMMDVLLPEARRRGYAPDVTITASEVTAGRPYPFMCLMNVLELGASSVRLCVKVDDTVAGIEEGLRAGMWTVGVTMTGNEVGLPRAELDALDPVLRNALATQARMHLGSAGAHYIIESVAELMPCLDDIEARLSRGEQP
jgi:phosphonoacetaldehyde hydrolase